MYVKAALFSSPFFHGIAMKSETLTFRLLRLRSYQKVTLVFPLAGAAAAAGAAAVVDCIAAADRTRRVGELVNVSSAVFAARLATAVTVIRDWKTSGTRRLSQRGYCSFQNEAPNSPGFYWINGLPLSRTSGEQMYRYRLLTLPSMNFSQISHRLLFDGVIVSNRDSCPRVLFSEAGRLKPGTGGESEFCRHRFSGFLGFPHGRAKSMIGNPFPAKLVLPFSANQPELALTVVIYRKITTGISGTDDNSTKASEHFFSSEKLKVCCTNEMCSMFIDNLCKAENLSDAVNLLQYLHNRQIHPDRNTYNSLLAAASETGDLDIFCDIFLKLLLSKQPPDITSYLRVSRVLPSLPDSKVLKFIREVSEITARNDPTVVNRIIFVAAQSGQIDRSVMIFEELKKHECKIDAVTFNTVLAILGRAGRVDEMLSEFSSMKELGYSPDIITYDTLINCLRRLGRVDLCKALAKEMLDGGFELDLIAYTALIDGLGRAGHVDEAMILFGEMKKCRRPSIYVYRAMISNLKKFGKIEAAMDLLKEMNSETSRLVGPEDFRKKKGRERK